MSVNSSLSSVHQLCWLAFMAATIAITALFPVFVGAVPITFQDCAVIICGIIMGPKQGAKAVALYTLAGAIGLPVFSGARGGIAHIAGPTGGYLAGFIILAFFAGLASRFFYKKQISNIIMALLFCLAGYGFLYGIGSLWLAYTMNLPIYTAIAVGVLPFLPGTGIKLFILFALMYSVHPQIIRFIPHATPLAHS